MNKLALIIMLYSINYTYSFDKITLKEKDMTEAVEQILEEIHVKNKILKNTKDSLIKNQINKYIDSIFILSYYYNLDPIYLTSLIWIESHFKKNAKSKVGASGLMQIMPKTKKYLLKKINRQEYISLIHQIKFKNPDISFNDAENLVLGSFYLNYLNKRFNNIYHSTAAYNMGPTWVGKKLKQNYPVGTKNHYINKIKKQYIALSH